MKTPNCLRIALAALLVTQLAAAEPVWPPETFTCYYGEITEQATEQLKDLDLLIVHPGDDGKNLNQDIVKRLRQSGKDKTIVGYVTIGEDDRPPGGPPIQGQDTSGPTFVGTDLTPKKANNGYPSQFMDQNKLLFGEDGFLQFGPNGKPMLEKGQDGHPDENGVWGSFYVKADDPAWRSRVFGIMDELALMGVDGFFLDTVDTASPWGDYGWTSAAMLDFVEAIRKRYPDKRIVGNRGLFFLNQNDRYAKVIDAVLFESLLTHYNWESNRGDISPWTSGHVDALYNDVAPSQKRTGLHLLVLDYLNPEQDDALALVQSDRTLLKDTPHSLSFNHPNLRNVGWTPQDLLPDPAPASWPTLERLEFTEESPGQYTLKAHFDSKIPAAAFPDLRITQDDVKVERAAQLAPAQLVSWKTEGSDLILRGNGLDKNQDYRAFLRLVSKSVAPQTGFGWTSFRTKSSELPSQVKDISASSEPTGLVLRFTADSLVAKSYRVYLLEEDGPKRISETEGSYAVLSSLGIGEAKTVYVVAVNENGEEGYPSLHKVVVRQDVVAPSEPGAVSLNQEGDTTTFTWESSSEAESYKLYVIPKGQTFRLPLLTSETEARVERVLPGSYKVFITAVDGAGNQSRPGPITEVTLK
jgi:hypothetical protein